MPLKRLTRIYTRTGDDGTTGLGTGERIPKDAPRVEAYGTVDELNSLLGRLLSQPGLPAGVADLLTGVQHRLFDLGGELCMPGEVKLADAHVNYLEQRLDGFNADLPDLSEFVLPGGNAAAADCHVARAVCRRAERRVLAVARAEPGGINPVSLRYLNRLSDLLFVLARVLARRDGGTEVTWDPGRADLP